MERKLNQIIIFFGIHSENIRFLTGHPLLIKNVYIMDATNLEMIQSEEVEVGGAVGVVPGVLVVPGQQHLVSRQHYLDNVHENRYEDWGVPMSDDVGRI